MDATKALKKMAKRYGWLVVARENKAVDESQTDMIMRSSRDKAAIQQRGMIRQDIERLG